MWWRFFVFSVFSFLKPSLRFSPRSLHDYVWFSIRRSVSVNLVLCEIRGGCLSKNMLAWLVYHFMSCVWVCVNCALWSDIYWFVSVSLSLVVIVMNTWSPCSPGEIVCDSFRRCSVWLLYSSNCLRYICYWLQTQTSLSRARIRYVYSRP